MRSSRLLLAILATVAMVLAACGNDDTETTATQSDDAAVEAESESAAAAEPATDADADADADAGAAEDEPIAETAAEPATVVVTTNILGDVIAEIGGGQFETVVIMPVGSDPHDFQASAQQVDQMQRADALIVNGAAFEEGLLDVIDAAVDDGVPTHEAIGPVSTIEFGEGGHSDDHDDEHGDDEHGGDEHGGDEHGGDEHGGDEHGGDEHGGDEHGGDEHGGDEHGGDEHGDDEHGDDEHGGDEHGGDEHGDDEHDHAHDGDDPHFFTDPARMAVAVEGIVDFLIDTIDGIDAEALEADAAAYIAELEDLEAELEEILAVVPEEQRLLVTNHDAFGYFADRYDFEVLGTIIPGGSTLASASARDLTELASAIGELGVPAVFAETTTSSQLAETLAAEVGDVEVVELFSGSLGAPDSDGGTYVEMVRTNAERIAAALGG